MGKCPGNRNVFPADGGCFFRWMLLGGLKRRTFLQDGYIAREKERRGKQRQEQKRKEKKGKERKGKERKGHV